MTSAIQGDIVPVFARNLRTVLEAGEEGGEKALQVIGLEGVNQVRKLLSRPGTGRTYRRRGAVHVASAPGEPPAVDSGRLRSSYLYATGREGGFAMVAIGTAVQYAPHLEYGTRRMAARPHLRPAIDRLRLMIGPTVAREVSQAQVSKVPK